MTSRRVRLLQSLPQPTIEHTYRTSAPNLHIVEIHDHDCTCNRCEPDRLTARHMGMLACAGAAVGSAIMFAINPAGALAALMATIGIVS